MTSNEEYIFKHNFIFYNLATKILTKIKHDSSLCFMSNESYKELMQTDILKSNEIYFKELLYRIYFANISGLFRSVKWMEGIVKGYESKNIFVLTTSMRGLLESCTDIFYSTSNVPKILVRDYHIFNDALLNKLNIIVGYKELEESLIHFIYAHKLSNRSELPETFKAKSAREYLLSLQNFDSSISNKLEEFYRYLCQFSHPSAYSLLLLNDNGNELNINLKNEEQLIEESITDFQLISDYLTQYSLNPILISLKIMNYLPLKEISLDIMKEIDLSNLKLWMEFEKIRNL